MFFRYVYLAFALWPSPACSCRPRKPPPPAGSKRVGASSARPPSSDTLGTRLIGRSSRRPPWPRRGRAPTGGGRRRAGGGPPGRGETRGRPCESWKGRKQFFPARKYTDQQVVGLFVRSRECHCICFLPGIPPASPNLKSSLASSSSSLGLSPPSPPSPSAPFSLTGLWSPSSCRGAFRAALSSLSVSSWVGGIIGSKKVCQGWN